MSYAREVSISCHGMIGLTDFVLLPPQTPTGLDIGSERSFDNPDGSLQVRFENADELRMGLDYWRTVKLIERGADVSSRHPILKDSVGFGPVPLQCYVPWSPKGDLLAVTRLTADGNGNLGSGCLIYRLQPPDVRYLSDSEWPRGVAWSPTADSLLVVTEGRCRIVNEHLQIPINVPNDLGWHRAPAIGWTPSGASFFCAGPSANGNGTSIHFYSADDGTRIATSEVDPLALVPYDVDAYAELDRDRYVLVFGPGMRGVARGLDDWRLCQYDAAANILKLAIYRPTSPVKDIRALGAQGSQDTERGCTVERRWVSARLVG